MSSLWDSGQQVKPKLHLPSLLIALGPYHCTQLSNSPWRYSDHPHRQEALCAAQHWTCKLGWLFKGIKLKLWDKTRLHSLFTYFCKFTLRGGGKGNNAASVEEAFSFFFLNCLKKQNYCDVKRGMILRRRKKSDCCFRTYFWFSHWFTQGRSRWYQWLSAQTGVKPLNKKL